MGACIVIIRSKSERVLSADSATLWTASWISCCGAWWMFSVDSAMLLEVERRLGAGLA